MKFLKGVLIGVGFAVGLWLIMITSIALYMLVDTVSKKLFGV